MSHSARGLQKALSQFRFNAHLDENAKKQMFGHLVDSIRARVATDPLQALNELSDTYNAIVNRKLKLKVDKNPSTASHQENIVLHALQTMYKQNLDRYLRDLHEKSASEKKGAVQALESNHKKIINQITGLYPVNIKQAITTMLLTTSPRVILPTSANHAPVKEPLKWQDDGLIKNNLIKTFVQTYHANAIKREKLADALAVKDSHYPQLDQKGIDQLDGKMEGMKRKIETLTEDPDQTIRQAATQALIDASLKAKVESTFLHQLLSGFKNPTKLKEKESAEYTPTDIAHYAHSLLTIMKPEEILLQINTFYEEAATPALKDKLLTNAMTLVHELITLDESNEFFPNFSNNRANDNPVAQQFNRLLQTIQNDTTFDPERQQLVKAFERNIRSASDLAAGLHEKTGLQIKSMLHVSDKDSEIDIQDYLVNELSTGVINNKKLLQTAKTVAADLKNIGLAHLASIKPTDLYGQAWSKANKKENTHIIKFIRHCDKLSYLIVNDIVNAKTTPHQEQIAIFYAHVLQEAIKGHDYSTVAAILGGFNKSAVHRLEHLKQIPEVSSALDKANELMSADNNFKNMRAVIERHKNEVSVPFMGVYLTDLTFADDKLPDLNSEKDVNVTKLDTLKNIYLDLKHKFQLAQKHLGTGQRSNILKKITQLEVDETIQYDRSQAFRAKTIEVPRASTLPELLAKFPNQKVPLFLEIKLNKNDKELVLTNKRAYKAILKLIIEKAHDANVVEKASAAKLVNSLLLAAQKNGLDTEKVKKLVHAAQMVTAAGTENTATLSFLGVVADQYYNVLALKAELEGADEDQSAKHLATKAEEIYHELTKATHNLEPRIAKMAKDVLELADLMNSIPTLSQKYQTLKVDLANIGHTKEEVNYKTKITIRDQMDKIEDQLRLAAKHSDARIRIPATVALTNNDITPAKSADKFKRAQPDIRTKKPAMIMSQHRRSGFVIEQPKIIEEPIAATPDPTALNNFLKDIAKAKNILENFHSKPKYKEKGRYSLQLIIKQLNESKINKEDLANPAFNISFEDYDKFFSISTLEYVARSLQDNPGPAAIERLIKESSKHWPEAKEILTQLSHDLKAEQVVAVRRNPSAH